MELNIEKCFNFNNNDIIVVGCSTGPDSMALVDMLLKIRKKYNLYIVIAHVNHNVRSQSYEEAEYMQNYCNSNNLVFETMTIEKYGDDNFENEARNIRYNFFEKLVNKYNANFLMTAHHGDDLIETILMRISRGSNLSGYGGFHKVVDMGNYKIVRPLIYFTKEQLVEYNRKNHIYYYVDASNSDENYTRNRYRRHVLPFLKNEDKNIHLKYVKFSENLDEVNNYIVKERNKALKNVYVNKKILISKFFKLDCFIQKEILYYLMSDFYSDDLILINDRHVKLINDLIHGRKVNGYINLPNEVIAIRNYNELELRKSSDEILSYEIEFNTFAKLPNGHIIEKVDSVDNNSNNICRINSKDVKLPLIIRTRKFGDRISVKGLNGSRKIKDIFIDKKIKVSDRDFWPIVVDSSGKVIWIPGIKKSKFDKNKNESYDIIMKYR